MEDCYIKMALQTMRIFNKCRRYEIQCRKNEEDLPADEAERHEIEARNENRDWLALSAKVAPMLRHILQTEKMTQKELLPICVYPVCR